ncbi:MULTISPECIES: hypothetical protein [unclassified Kitasatospora]|uniref:hypothetical protein n=1 Tax=unclassified Kitasatospora TaxID=2633591 RepID=UPI0006718023|nr:hypothetical protein [Kitasatospora sp. MY 5-36]
MRILVALAFLIPLFLGVAMVTDYRGFSKWFTQPSGRSSKDGPAGIHLVVGWGFTVLSSVMVIRILVSLFFNK